jgi:hypothetical protein
VKALLTSLVLLLGLTSASFGAVLPEDFTLDLTDVTTVGGALLTGLGAIWAIKRAFGLLSK